LLLRKRSEAARGDFAFVVSVLYQGTPDGGIARLNYPAFTCLKIREHLLYVAEVEASGRSATVSSTVGSTRATSAAIAPL